MRATSVLALAGALAASGCSIPDSAKQDASNVLLVVTNVVTQAGGSSGGTESAFLLSDVVRVEDPSGFFNDNATLTLTSIPKNPAEDLTLSQYDTAVLERYTVRFFRSDGRNTEGEDVPFGFQGALAGTVPAGNEAEVALILVRHQAKREPPLSRLQQGGGADLLTCFAEVNVFGRTLKGDVVSAKTTISVTFADFGD